MAVKSLAEKNVLIIDANQPTQDKRASVLRANGVHVHTADNILQAESMWVANFFDLILLDVRQNTAEGMAFFRRVRRENPKQRILVMGKPFAVLTEAPAA